MMTHCVQRARTWIVTVYRSRSNVQSNPFSFYDAQTCMHVSSAESTTVMCGTRTACNSIHSLKNGKGSLLRVMSVSAFRNRRLIDEIA